MDSDGLPLVGPGIDLTKVGAINQKRILAFLNHYLTNTVQYLNRFSCVCEEKLTDLTIKLQRLETTLNILESKLSSIPGLENVTVATTADTAQSAPVANGPTSDVNANPVAAPVTTSTQDTTGQQQQPAPAQAEAEPAEPEVPKMTVSKHPRYAQFFKMLNMGVPEMAIKQKMSIEGLDPNILDTPNAPAPDVDPSEAQKRDEDSDDFTDDDSSSNQDDSDAFSD